MKHIFAVYKPSGMTSHDVVNLVRRITRVKRVGHGGTLDPLATGVLVIAVGRENTKQLDKYVKGEKEYVATIKLGEYSTTDDEEGIKTPGPNPTLYPRIDTRIQETETVKHIKTHQPIPSRNDIVRCMENFIGIFPQTPPIYSAKKVKGTTSYRLARRGLDIKLEPKEIEIMHIELLSYSYPFLTIRVITGSGVYIRSLARDIGQSLETGAYLYNLERTKVAGFGKNDAITLDHLEKYLTEQ